MKGSIYEVDSGENIIIPPIRDLEICFMSILKRIRKCCGKSWTYSKWKQMLFYRHKTSTVKIIVLKSKTHSVVSVTCDQLSRKSREYLITGVRICLWNKMYGRPKLNAKIEDINWKLEKNQDWQKQNNMSKIIFFNYIIKWF